MTDFWISSGHHLLDHDADGRLAITDELLKAYLARPEIVPPEDACLVERALYDRIRREPRTRIPADEIKNIADRDARENWRYLVAFRDELLKASSIEGAYLSIVRQPKVAVPPLFLNQLVHVILRNILDRENDAFRLRAAELLFRAQRLTLNEGVMLLADEEVVDGANVDDHASPLVAVFGDARVKSLDILGPANAPQYRGRSDAFDMVFDFRHGQPGRAAFARVIEAWVAHMLGVTVRVEPIEQLVDESWSWFVGLDQEGTAIGNALWKGEEPAREGRERIVALFRLTFDDPREMLERVAGKPVYLILGMTPNRIVRVKPQNLLVSLPVRSAGNVS